MYSLCFRLRYGLYRLCKSMIQVIMKWQPDFLYGMVGTELIILLTFPNSTVTNRNYRLRIYFAKLVVIYTVVYTVDGFLYKNCSS